MKAEAEAVTIERSASDVRRDVRAIFDERQCALDCDWINLR